MTENFRKKNFETMPENRFTKKTFSDNIVTPALEKTTENDFGASEKPARTKKSDISAFSGDNTNGISDSFDDSNDLSYTPKRKDRIDQSQKPYESLDFADMIENDYEIDRYSPFSDYPLTGKLGIRNEAYGETKNHSGINRKMPEGTYIRLPMDVKYKNSGYDYEHGNWIELEDIKGNTLSYRNLMDFGDFTPGAIIPLNSPIARSGKDGKKETLREEYYSPEGRNITESYWRDYREPDSKKTDIESNFLYKAVSNSKKEEFPESFTVSSAKTKPQQFTSFSIRKNNIQKDAQRGIWRMGAQEYLREKKGYLTSAWMLEHSLDDNPSDVYRGNDSRIAGLINQDKAYLDALDRKISESTDGTISGYLKNVSFDKGDLYYSIHNATIFVDGYQLSNGKWLIKGTLKDVYDFTKIQSFFVEDGKIKSDISLGTVANDVAVFSQATGAINPYNVYVEFYTVR